MRAAIYGSPSNSSRKIELERKVQSPLLLIRSRQGTRSKRKVIVTLVLFCCVFFYARVSDGQGADSQIHPSTVPTDKLNDAEWDARHNTVLKRIKDNPNATLVLIGDSITQNYEKANPPYENFLPTWQRFYAPRNALNLGFSGDTTENVLWRLDHGEVDGISPKAVLILIGTNNTGLENPLETELGIDAVVAKVEQKLPNSSILLIGILPKEEKAAAIKEVNQYLANRYATDPKVAFLDIEAIFYKDGKLNEDLFYDPREYHSKALHPDTVGQRMMAEAIEPTLTRLLGDRSRQYLATLREVNTATIPVPRLEMDSYDWYQRHRDVLNLKNTINPQVVLVGDSITHFWGGVPRDHAANGQSAWDHVFAGMPVLNLGFGWDRTQNVLWRLAHGEFDGLHPKTVIINIGTNNLTATENARANTPDEIVQGILAIRDEIHVKSPSSRIIVMGVFPRGAGSTSPFRESISTINQLLSKALVQEANTAFLDIGSQFLTAEGTLPPNLMADGLHPTGEGYELWAKALIAAGVRN